ncbi:MAG TPA: sigma-70 family RNA polymerase sigma factor [Chloroflexia bacterium]|nr:sigma-70 family RNA polymerase sigma factor [Chloroflexia bacterium]
MTTALAYPTAAGVVTPAHPASVPSTAEATAQAEERVWIDRALAGDQAAFGCIVERYQQAVYNLCYRMLGGAAEAEDGTQEVFIRAWTQLHSFQRDRKFSTWLLAIASHHCIDMLRRRRGTQVPLDTVEIWATSRDPEPEASAVEAEEREAVRGLLATLPPKYRLVTVLRYFRDLSYLEIADLTGLSESAVKTQLHRARKMLADQIRVKGAPAHVLPIIS